MTSTTDRAPAIEYAWSAHPAGLHPRRAVAVALVIAAFAALLGMACGSMLVSVISALVLMVSLNRFYFTSRFEIDAEGITARYPLRTQRLEWASTRRFLHDQFGGYLSTRARASRWDAFRGMHLLFGADRDAAIAHIRQRVGQRVGQ
jgi:hypothetical protein